MEKDEIIKKQNAIIVNILKVSTLQQAMVNRIMDAMKMYAMEMKELSKELGNTAPEISNAFKPYLVPDPDKKEDPN